MTVRAALARRTYSFANIRSKEKDVSRKLKLLIITLHTSVNSFLDASMVFPSALLATTQTSPLSLSAPPLAGPDQDR